MSIGSPISLTVADLVPFMPRRFTVEEYRRMAELGVLGEDDRVELLEGVITPKMMHNPPHDTSVTLVEEALRRLMPTGWYLRIQLGLTTGDSEPEPDVAIVRGRARDYTRRHPQARDVGLVVEVAESSLARDRIKARLYARAGVLVYYIVNLVNEQVELHTQPRITGGAPSYGQLDVYSRGESVPVILEGPEIGRVPVDELLP